MLAKLMKNFHLKWQYLADIVLLGTTVTKERSIFGIREVMIFMTNFGTYSTNSNPIYHLASVAVVPEIKKCTSNNSASKGKEKRDN